MPRGPAMEPSRSQPRPSNGDGFTYAKLAGTMRAEIQEQTRAIHKLIENTTRNVIQIGLRLQFVRDCIGRDRFQPWLKAEFQWSQSVASNYMAAARVFSDVDCLEQFQPSALFVLARRKVPPRAYHEAVELARSGEQISKSRAEQIVAKYLADEMGPAQNEAAQRVRRYVENLLKTLPQEETPQVVSQLFCLAEELQRRICASTVET